MKLILLFLILITTFSSCNEKEISQEMENGIFGLATPITLNPNETEIHLEDFFTDVSKIDSIQIPNSLSKEITKDKKILTLQENGSEIPLISTAKVWVDGIPYSLLLKKSRKISHKITFDSKGKNYETVQVAGAFNNWSPKNSPMQNKGGIWETKLLLDPGNYHYQIVADGKWFLDPANPDSADNNIGGFNSVLQVGEKKDSAPKIFTKEAKDGKIILEQSQDLDKVLVFWQNFELTNFTQNLNQIEIPIPRESTILDRSFLRVFASNKNGTSNDILIPLSKGHTLKTSSEITRRDKEATILYFLLVDRFFNGNKENDEPVVDSEVHPKANYFGGDLDGITQKAKEGYFKDLNISTVWISPISQNPLQAHVEYPEPHRKFSGYHGYWPISSSKVDHRFGDSNSMKKLVETVHSQNMNLILDFVSNHVHEEHPIFQNNPNWATKLDLPNGKKNIRIWDEQRLTTWFDTFLPSLDYSNPKVTEVMTDSALYWIQTYGIDGFRHDATKHIPISFWREMTKKIKKEVSIPQNRNLFQIGETFGSRELIGSYVNSGLLDGQFDFNLYFDARAVFALENESFSRLKNSLNESLTFYGSHSLMGNITGNHDIPRFISYASGALKFDEDSQEAGWERNIKVEDKVGYKKLSQLTAFAFTIPGIPVIYYGDEFGMAGAGDPDNRRQMRFKNLTKEEQQTKEIAKKITKLRKENLELIYGDLEILECSDKTFVFARTYFDQISIVAFNKDSKSRKIRIKVPERFKGVPLNSNFGSVYGFMGREKASELRNLEIDLQPNSFEILTN
ncbi:MAG: alpha-amlyase [Calditrichaeota bacterium]|nr:MAG: alpha-amlyase [Calditrichota bacterium]